MVWMRDHNPPAADAFSASLRKFAPTTPFALVAGFCADKDVETCLKALRPRFKVAFATETPSERTLPAGELASAMRRVGFARVTEASDWRKAYADAIAWAKEQGGGVAVLGSLFLAGAVANGAGNVAGVLAIPSEKLVSHDCGR